MATTLSNYIGPSDVTVLCYKKDNFKEQIAKDYKIDSNKIETIKTNETLEELLKEYYSNDKKIIPALLYHINNTLKEVKNIYKPNNYLIEKLSGSENKYCVFYTVEDIFIVESNNYMYLFVLGNFE